ncbi:MAG: DUF123 domain-containing protein, partial [Fibrobacterota bacterium]
DFHTDPAFSAVLSAALGSVDIICMGVSWDRNLHLHVAREVPLDMRAWEKHGADSGIYAVCLFTGIDRVVSIGALGEIRFPAGYYLYVGSAKQGLSKRIARHRRRRKNMHWHIDYLRDVCDVVQAWPIRLQGSYECSFARDIAAMADDSVPRFGASDCSCTSHLFHFHDHPGQKPEFQDILLRYRADLIWE